MDTSYLSMLKLAVPELMVTITVIFVLAVDLTALRGVELLTRRSIGAMISCVGCVLAIGWMVAMPAQGNLAAGMLVVDPLTQLVKIVLLALTICTLVLSVDADFTTHAGEFLALVLLATLGMMFLAGSEDVLMVFIALELTSLSLYILTAFDKRNVKSAEAALKYFLFGGLAAAFTLFGLSLLYGLSGATNFSRIAAAVSVPELDPLLILAIVMVVIGFGFKIAAVPFHLWAPDAYQGAPAPAAALIASGSKVASFFVLAKVMIIGFKGAGGLAGWHHYAPGWVPLLAILATASMILGNLTALVQGSVRRLLAYSAIAHAGYMLLGILPGTNQGVAALVYYAATYGLTTVGAFGVVSVVERKTGGESFSDFAGLCRRAPVVSFCMMIFMLSLAGIPPLAGFFGKFYVFAGALGSGQQGLGLLWLVVVALTMSAVSLYYYLKVLKQIYVAEPASGAVESPTPMLTQVVLVVIAIAVVLLGCAPDVFVSRLNVALQVAGFPVAAQ